MQLSTTILVSMLAGVDALKGYRWATEKYEMDTLDYEILKFEDAISPKAVILSPFGKAASGWKKYFNFSEGILVPGLSPLYPEVYCTKNYDICSIVTGEGSATSASSVSAFLSSPQFNLTETYFLVTSLSYIDSWYGSLGSVIFGGYSAYEEDQWSYSWYDVDDGAADGSNSRAVFGLFEVNRELQKHAADLASRVNLSDSQNLTAVRAALHYNRSAYGAGQPPRVVMCDTGSDEFRVFADSDEDSTMEDLELCTNPRDQPAILEAAVHSAKFGLTDFARWVLLTGAVEYPDEMELLNMTSTDVSNLSISDFSAKLDSYEDIRRSSFKVALKNVRKAGYPFIKDVLSKWNSTYYNGTFVANSTVLAVPVAQVNGTELNITMTNYTMLNGSNATNSSSGGDIENGAYAPESYIGDVYGSLGVSPDIGPLA